MKNGLSTIAPLALMSLMARELQENTPPGETPEKSPPPPWVNARYDIPKSIRKGKTYEEILEIKKQIWIDEQLNGELVCLKCGKTKKADDDDTDKSEFLLTPKGILCKDCVDAEGQGEKNE
jgi:hypothetical protein